MKKENIKSIIIIALIVIFFLSTTYAFLNFGAANNSATGQGGCFEVGYSGEMVSTPEELGQLKSTTNYLEGAHTQITLYKDPSCEVYSEASIYIHTNENSDVPLDDNNAFKYIILNGEEKILEGSIVKQTTEDGTTEDNLLVTVPLTTEQKLYDIYIWVDSSLSNGVYNGKTFSGYLYAKSTQTSTIK